MATTPSDSLNPKNESLGADRLDTFFRQDEAAKAAKSTKQIQDNAYDSTSIADFATKVMPQAERVASRLGVSVDSIIGQWGLETGWGKSVIPGTNNLGNIKDFSGNGVEATDNATGTRDKYKVFDSLDSFADGHADLLSRKYKGALNAGNDAAKFFTGLKAGGYAEDPTYVEKGTAAAAMVAKARQGMQPAQPVQQQPSAADNAPKWSTIIAKPEYLNMSAEDRAGARQAYFDKFIAPDVPMSQRAEVKAWFDGETAKLEPKEPSLLDRAKETIKKLYTGGTTTPTNPDAVYDPVTGVELTGYNNETDIPRSQRSVMDNYSQKDATPAKLQPQFDPNVVGFANASKNLRAYQDSRAQDIEKARMTEGQKVVNGEGRKFTPIVNDRTWGQAAGDTFDAAAKIIPTALKGTADITAMLTNDAVGRDFSDYMQSEMDKIDAGSSPMMKSKRAELNFQMSNDNYSAGDILNHLVTNPSIFIDQAAPSVGSMLFPAGAVRGAIGLAARLGGNASKFATVATLGTVAAQNAADTFAELRGLPTEDRYAGATVAATISVLAGIATKGGAEGQIARKMIGEIEHGKTTIAAARELIKGMTNEAFQEGGEEFGNALGEAIGKDEDIDPRAVVKRMTLAGTLGAAIGGGTDIAVHASGENSDAKAPLQPIVPKPAYTAKADPVEPTATPVAESAPTAKPVDTTANKDLVDYAEYRKEILIAKRDGEAVDVPSEDGSKMVTVDKAGKGLSKSEQAELTAIEQAGTDAEKLAAIYPEMKETPSNVPEPAKVEQKATTAQATEVATPEPIAEPAAPPAAESIPSNATESKQDTISRLMKQAKVEKGIDKPTERNKAFQRGMIDAVEGKEPQRASSAYIAGHTFAQDKLNNKETVKNEPQATETALPTVQEEARQGSSLSEQSTQSEQVKAEQAATGAPEATAGSAQPGPVTSNEYWQKATPEQHAEIMRVSKLDSRFANSDYNAMPEDAQRKINYAVGKITGTKPVAKPKTEKERNQQADYSEKWFGSQDKAQAFIDKKRIGETHQVVQNGKKFEIKAKSVEAAPVEAAKPVAPEPKAKPKTEKAAKAIRESKPINVSGKSRSEVQSAVANGEKVTREGVTKWVEETKVGKHQTYVVKTMEDGRVFTKGPKGPAGADLEWGWSKSDAVEKAVESWSFADEQVRADANPAPDLNSMFDDVLAEEVAKTKTAGNDANIKQWLNDISSALEKDLNKKKARLSRLQNEAKADNITLEEKLSRQTKVKAAEATLRKMRQSIFDAEDAANEAFNTKDISKFSNHADLFDSANSLLNETINNTSANPTTTAKTAKVEVYPMPAKKPKTEKQAKEQRTTGQAAVSAAKNTAEGFANAINGLGELFGVNNPGTFGSGPVINEDTYAKAKPLFQAAVANFEQAGADIKEVMRAVVKSVLEKFGESVVNNMKPYIVRFVSEYSEQKTENLVDHLYNVISNGNMPKDNPALRKIVAEYDKKEVTPARLKQAQEDIEAAIARVARDEVAKGGTDAEIFARLEALYQSQPNLNIRTSTSVENQAYSTPAPLAFLAARLAGIDKNAKTYEPTAGNGMLLITANPANATANELEDQRFANLKAQGFKAMQGDALEADVKPKSQDSVITNPPFGSVKDDNGNPIKVPVDGYKIGKIDHLIAAKALDAMKDDGKATLILGADKVTGGISADDRTFFNWLYSHYNVTGHFEVDGKLYTRQGAGWPVRVISINGRKESTNVSPRPGVIERAKSWSDVYEQFSNILGSQNKVNGNPASNSNSAGETDAGNDVRPSTSTTGAEAIGTDQRKSARGKASAGDVGRTSTGTRGNSESVPAEGLANSDNSNDGNAESSKSDRLGQGGKASGETQDARAAKSVGNSGSDSVEGNEFQGKYIPRSARKDEGVLIPINMRDSTQDALSRLEDEVGDIDEFAAKELGYKSVAALHDALMGLQVDSVATAISQIKRGKGVVIADQTGIGKGRQAASIIRWAAKNGKIPVFVTVKPSLFTDMYGDLADIGSHDIKPFILNMDESISGKNGEKLFANKKATHKQTINDIARTNSLPNGTNALFMTYSQINTDNAQRRAVMALADKAVFILDESHNAAGESNTGQFMVGALGAAQGVTYLSATFAKRPDNIPLYFKTDIGDAIGDDQALMNAMLAGGLPLQTVVSNNLVKSGQMFRRERSYDGVSISTNVDEANRAEHEKLSDRVTTALRSIVSADATFHEVFFKEMRKQMEELGGTALDIAGNQATESVNHTEFSSVVHNFVRQLLLGLKADTAAKRAIAAIKAGKKPIIAVENTMGSFLQEYAANNNIAQDSPLGSFDYRTVLSRALDRTRHVVKVDAKGNKVKSYVPLKDLDPITRAAYGKAQRIIDSLDMDIPVSPIDWMRAALQREGYSVAEITGRNLAVDYTDPKKPVLTKLSAEEQKDKVLTTKKFNSGKLDALILNVAGSTGISLHASEKFKDKRPRHMIIAQAAQDINIFMQMLGRSHRTGQVVLPSYEILNVDLPAEKRPTALLSKNMKSLNANTSSNTESATSVKAVDMMNKYGDQVVAQYLDDNPDIRRELGFSGNLSNEDGKVEEDIARKATGRLALMPVEIQKHVYADIEDQYNTLIEYLNKTNQNDLEPRTFDYDAKETKQEILFKGDKPNSPFGADAVYNEFSIKAQGVAMTPAEINTAMAENLGGKNATAHAVDIIGKMAVDNEAYFAKQVQALKDAGETDINMAEYDPATDPKKLPAVRFVNSHRIGSTFRIEINGDIYNAVVTNIRNIHKGNGSPYAMSKIHVTVAVNGALRSVTVPATQFNRIEVAALGSGNIDRLFEAVPRNERQTAKIITGNLLAAYGELKDTKGTIVNFTREDGSVDQGILLPKKFDFKSNTMGDFNLRSGAEVLNFLMNSENKDVSTIGVQNRENTVRVIPEGSGITIFVPKSKAKGAKYFLNKDLLAKTGDFTSAGSFMTAEVSGAKAEEALNALMKITSLYAPASMADEAKNLVGRGGDSVELNDLAQDGPAMQLDDVQRVATLARLKSLTTKRENGKITNAEYLLAVKELTSDIQARNESRVPEPKTRGAEWIKERLIRAGRLGEINQETADFALWFLEKYPHAANDLAISIRSAGDNTPAGSYRSAERLMTLFKGSTNEGTATHEILHHMERMMPPEIQRKIMREWQKAWNNAWSKGDDKVKKALSDMLKSSMGDKNAFDSIVKAFRDGTLNYDEHYQLTNASEYWAVNATRIMSSRYDANSWIAQAKQFMKELIEKIKGLLKLDSDAEVLRALKAVLNGDGEYKSSRLLAELKAVNDIPSQRDTTERTQQELIKEFGKPTFSSIDWWDKSVGTQFHKAAKNPHYAKVFNLFLSRENATSITAVRAAELAPGFLPRVDDFKSAAITVLKGKKASKQHDLAGQAILEGTLQGDSVLQGVVWSDEELRGKGLDEQGIALYRQARQAIDASLDEVAAAEGYAAVQMFVPRALRDTILDNPKDAVNVLRTAIDKRISMDMKRLKAMTERGATDEAIAALEKDIEDAKAALETMENIFGHSDLLKDAGYAPLMRFGKYFVSVEEKDPITGKTIVNDKGEPNTLFFSRYETEGEAQEAYFRMMSQHGNDQSLKVISGPVNNEKYKMYAGISPETLALFAEAIGAKEVENKFYQEAISERSALKRRLERKAIAGYSQDLPRVLANFITSNGRHAAGRYYTRDINAAIKYIPREKGDVQEEAQKLKEFLDNPKDAGAMASGLAFTWFLGGNPASAAINATQPVMMTLPYLSQWGAGKAAAALTKAVPVAMGKKQITDAQLRHDLKRASQEGKVDAQEIFHLYTVGIQGVAGALNGKMSKLPLIGKHVKGASESGRARMNAALTLWGMPFAVVEGFNRRLSFIAAWNMAKEQGEADPYAFAVRAVDETQGIYNKVNRPNWARSGVGRTVFTFTQFRVMNVELLKRMATQGGPAGKRAAALYLSVLILAAGFAGLPYADDVDDIIDTVGQFLGYDTNMKRKKREWAYNTLGKFYGDLALYGMSSQLPMDFGGRMGLGNMVPATGVAKLSNKDKTANELLELGGPVIGGLGKQAADAYEEAAVGNYGKAAAAMAPSSVKNLAAGLDMIATGKAKDLKGREKIDVTPAEGAIKAFGFNPTKVANISRQNMPLQQDIALQKIVESNIVDKWAQGVAQNDQAMVSEAMNDMEKWNRKNPDTPVAISPNQIMSKAKSLMQPADPRMLKSAPKEMRGRVAAGLSKFD